MSRAPKPTPAPSPEPQGAIHSALENLDNELDRLRTSVEIMESRLYPVLREVEVQAEAAMEGFPTPSPCARAIVEKIWRVQELAHRVNNLIDRLDV